MRIDYHYGSIFQSISKVIVNAVNCVGIMGAGIARAFAMRYPNMYYVYRHDCKTGRLHVGRPCLYKACQPWILNFPTKKSWRDPSTLQYIESGLLYFTQHYKEAGITSISFPQLGTGNGGLSWENVGPLMVRYLAPLDIPVSIYIKERDWAFQLEDLQLPTAERASSQNIQQDYQGFDR
ncbi:Appr-1-p processing protein [Ktedonosporobacter rubrisoli]|uniref:Appr-1-p processing protein n=1 Tax=Ktedonosporobacter rubrisoli TaxID=2509675 RepID=A0A4P6K3E7_KTERU|nr:macro domain-containing protein [Ktedonosporobacter rubrisoli]QBD82433.1 Appr-1-p processing protein [Ktedonosporobacter rubrisoli]